MREPDLQSHRGQLLSSTNVPGLWERHSFIHASECVEVEETAFNQAADRLNLEL